MTNHYSFSLQKTINDALNLSPSIQQATLYTTTPVAINLTLAASTGNVALNTNFLNQAAFSNGLPLAITDGANAQYLTINLLGQPTGTRAAELLNILNLQSVGNQGLLKFFFGVAPVGGGNVHLSSDDPSVTGGPLTISNASHHSSVIVTATSISPPTVSLTLSS